MSENETLKEIQDPIARAKLQGLQEAVYSADHLILQTNTGIHEKRGIIAAADFIAKRLKQEFDPVAKAVKDEVMEPEEGKIRNDQTMKLYQIVLAIKAENENDLVMMRGQIVGLEKAVKGITLRFNSESAKYQKWQRLQEEAEGEDGVDDLGRPIPAEETPDKTDEDAPSAGEDAQSAASEPKAESTPAPDRKAVAKAIKRAKAKAAVKPEKG